MGPQKQSCQLCGPLFFVFCYAIFDRGLSQLTENGAFHYPERTALFHIWLCVEVDAVGYSDKHIAVCNPVVLGHAHTDAVASRVDHRLEVSGRVSPVVDGALGCVGCASEHCEVGSEAVGISGIGSTGGQLAKFDPADTRNSECRPLIPIPQPPAAESFIFRKIRKSFL